MIGSVTALMIVKNSARSRRSLRTSSVRLPRPRIWSIFWPSTVFSHFTSPVNVVPLRRSSRPTASS
jgi:hypothetical protein